MDQTQVYLFFSCYQQLNFLQKIKNLIKNPRNPNSHKLPHNSRTCLARLQKCGFLDTVFTVKRNSLFAVIEKNWAWV